MRNEDANIFFTLGPGPLVKEFWGEGPQRRAKELGFTVRLNPREGPQPPEYWAEAFEGLDALITTWGAPKLDEKVLARNDTLKIVGHAAGSVAGIVSPVLYERGVPVVNANAIMARTVAEWCLMTTLVGWSRFLDYTGLGDLSAMQWSDRGLVRGMQNATIAIWGYGQISSRLIELLKPYGPKEILVYSGHLKPEEAEEIGITLVEFDELFSRGDVIHLLGALTEKNVGKVGASQLAAIREGSVLVNAGRAALVQEDALPGGMGRVETGERLDEMPPRIGSGAERPHQGQPRPQAPVEPGPGPVVRSRARRHQLAVQLGPRAQRAGMRVHGERAAVHGQGRRSQLRLVRGGDVEGRVRHPDRPERRAVTEVAARTDHADRLDPSAAGRVRPQPERRDHRVAVMCDRGLGPVVGARGLLERERRASAPRAPYRIHPPGRGRR